MSLSSVWFGWQPEMERNSAMMPTTKRLLTSCGLYLAIHVAPPLVALVAFMLLASSGLARREAYS